MKGFPVTLEFPVHWGDVDALRHVNNTRYIAWFETARVEYLRHLGFGDASLLMGDIGPILAAVTCDYLIPIHFPATVCVGTKVATIGNTSFRMEHVVERGGCPHEILRSGHERDCARPLPEPREGSGSGGAAPDHWGDRGVGGRRRYADVARRGVAPFSRGGSARLGPRRVIPAPASGLAEAIPTLRHVPSTLPAPFAISRD